MPGATSLTRGHHDAVASLEEDEQDRWLAWAVEYEATVQELRDAIRAEKEQDPDGGESGSGDEEEARIEFDTDEDGACRVCEVRLDLNAAEHTGLPVAHP